MATRVHRPLKVIAFNTNGMWRQRYELSKQLQDLHTDVSLLSEIHLKTPCEVLHSKLSLLSDCFRGGKGGIAVAVRTGIPHNHVDLSSLVSIDVTGTVQYSVTSCQYYAADRGNRGYEHIC
jgi:hypothetical protein